MLPTQLLLLLLLLGLFRERAVEMGDMPLPDVLGSWWDAIK